MALILKPVLSLVIILSITLKKRIMKQDVSEPKCWALLFFGNMLALLGLQILLFWIGSHWPTVENLGLYFNFGTAFLMLYPFAIFIRFGESSELKSTILFALAFGGLYVYITFVGIWWLGIISLLLIFLGIFFGQKEKLNTYVIYGSIGFYLLYVCCAWGAMIIMNLSPAVSIWEWGILVFITIVIWFTPLCKK